VHHEVLSGLQQQQQQQQDEEVHLQAGQTDVTAHYPGQRQCAPAAVWLPLTSCSASRPSAVHLKGSGAILLAISRTCSSRLAKHVSVYGAWKLLAVGKRLHALLLHTCCRKEGWRTHIQPAADGSTAVELLHAHSSSGWYFCSPRVRRVPCGPAGQCSSGTCGSLARHACLACTCASSLQVAALHNRSGVEHPFDGSQLPSMLAAVLRSTAGPLLPSNCTALQHIKGADIRYWAANQGCLVTTTGCAAAGDSCTAVIQLLHAVCSEYCAVYLLRSVCGTVVVLLAAAGVRAAGLLAAGDAAPPRLGGVACGLAAWVCSCSIC
jgi:hypothetical protein